MQTANVMLSLAGDHGNTVPKYNITASEIAVLRVIHGDDSVHDIEPAGEMKLTHREERQRLIEKYGRQQEGRFISPAVDSLFPGAAARVFETLDELDLPEDLYKPKTRMKAAETPVKNESEKNPLDDMTKADLVDYADRNGIEIDASAKKADIKKAIEAAEANAKQPAGGDDVDENDGIGDMPDSGMFD